MRLVDDPLVGCGLLGLDTVEIEHNALAIGRKQKHCVVRDLSSRIANYSLVELGHLVISQSRQALVADSVQHLSEFCVVALPHDDGELVKLEERPDIADLVAI